MKKKVRAKPTVPFYSNEPAVSRNKMADNALSPSAGLAPGTPKMVDKSPGKLSGIAGFTSKTKPATKPTGIAVPKIGTKSGAPQQGKLRASGHSGAHQLGKK